MNRVPVLVLLIGLLVALPGAILSTAGSRVSRATLQPDSLLLESAQTLFTVPKGTKLHIRLKDKLPSADSEGSFKGVLDRPVKSNGRVVLPPGVLVTGEFVFKEPSKTNKKRPAMTMRLNQLRVDGKRIRIKTEVLAFGVPVPDDGARLKALDSDDTPGRPPSYSPGAMLTFKLAEPVQVPDAHR